MPPDLHTLPLSRSPTASPTHPRVLSSVTEPYRRQTPSPRSSSFSLAAAATINAGNQAQNEESRRSSTTPSLNRVSPITSRSERRRSYVGLTLEMNDPTTPSPGEMQSPQRRGSASFMTQHHRMSGSVGDPYHQRNPSLGELHQELEQEQEAQVNRLLGMIRQQQLQLQQLQQSTGNHASAIEDLEHPLPTSTILPTLPRTLSNARSRSPNLRTTHNPARQSHGSSRSGSPMLMSSSHSQLEDLMSPGGGRDEAAFYQAETQMLNRENQMLRNRIRELEKQLHELNHSDAASPTTHSNLVGPPIQQSSGVEASAGTQNGGEAKK